MTDPTQTTEPTQTPDSAITETQSNAPTQLTEEQQLELLMSNPEKVRELYYANKKNIGESIQRKEKLKEESALRDELAARLTALEEEKKKAAMDAEERTRYEQQQKQQLAEELEARIQKLKRENEELSLLGIFSQANLHDPKDALRSYGDLPEEQRAATTPEQFLEQLQQQKAYLFKPSAVAAPATPAHPVVIPTTANPVVPGARERIEGKASIPTVPRTKDDVKALNSGWAQYGKASK